MLGLCWPMLGLCWPMLSHLGSYAGAMFGSSMLKRSEDANFSAPGPAQNHVKTEVLWHRQDEIPCRRRARNTVKKRCFFNTASKHIVNYMSFSRGGVDTGWVGGRGRSAYNLLLPSKASGKDTGSVVAGAGFKGWRLTAGRRRSNDFWLVVWEDWAEILRANPGRAMLNWGRHNAQCLPVWKIMEAVWSYVERRLCPCWAKSGPCWAILGPSWAYVGQVGPMLSHRAHLGPILAKVGPISSQCCLMLLSEPTRS